MIQIAVPAKNGALDKLCFLGPFLQTQECPLSSIRSSAWEIVSSASFFSVALFRCSLQRSCLHLVFNKWGCSIAHFCHVSSTTSTLTSATFGRFSKGHGGWMCISTSICRGDGPEQGGCLEQDSGGGATCPECIVCGGSIYNRAHMLSSSSSLSLMLLLLLLKTREVDLPFPQWNHI